jgi:enoyl-CoA hydratase/carnithine racemase
MTDHIRTDLSDGILSVAFARPEKKNAITQEMYAALAEATQRAKTDDAVRVLLFRAESDSFSAGNDIADFIAIGSQGGQALDMPVFRFLKAMADLDKPAVAAVRGRAVGIGLTLLLHCDMVVVAEDALLSAPFINLALAPEAASSLLLPQVLGHQRAFEIFALGEPIDGRTAEAWGLANRAVASDQVEATALELAGAAGGAGPQLAAQDQAADAGRRTSVGPDAARGRGLRQPDEEPRGHGGLHGLQPEAGSGFQQGRLIGHCAAGRGALGATPMFDTPSAPVRIETETPADAAAVEALVLGRLRPGPVCQDSGAAARAGVGGCGLCGARGRCGHRLCAAVGHHHRRRQGAVPGADRGGGGQPARGAGGRTGAGVPGLCRGRGCGGHIAGWRRAVLRTVRVPEGRRRRHARAGRWSAAAVAGTGGCFRDRAGRLKTESTESTQSTWCRFRLRYGRGIVARLACGYVRYGRRAFGAGGSGLDR